MAITGLGAAERGGHSTRARWVSAEPSGARARVARAGGVRPFPVEHPGAAAHTSGYLGRGCWVVSRMSNAEIETSVCPARGVSAQPSAPLFNFFYRLSGIRRPH